MLILNINLAEHALPVDLQTITHYQQGNGQFSKSHSGLIRLPLKPVINVVNAFLTRELTLLSQMF